MTRARATGSNGLHLEALASRFVVTCASEREAAVLQRQWSRLRAGTKATPRDIPIDLRSMPSDQQGRALLTQVTIWAIEAAAGTRLMLHAAGVADADGRVLALVGPSGMGKTTASVYLSRHGFGYVTDETVSIGPDGDVLPFGRPLSLRRPGGEVQRSPDELGLGRPSGELIMARIVLLDRIPGHAEPTLTAVPLVDALLELIPQTSALAQLPGPLQLMTRTIDRCGGVLRLTYGEMDDRVMSLVSELLGREADATDPWRAMVPQQQAPDELASEQSAIVDDQEPFHGAGLLVAGDDELPTMSASPKAALWDGRWRQAAVQDAIRVGDEALLLVAGVPMRLAGIGMTIWRAVGDTLEREEILAAVVGQHGSHPDAEQLVDEALQSLVSAGAVRYHRR